MAKARRLAPDQLRALDRLSRLEALDRFYLAGATAIAWHLGHRRSADLDLFSRDRRAPLAKIKANVRGMKGIEVVDTTDVMLALKVGPVPVDLVQYPYPLLDPPVPGPHGFPVAQLRDLAAMKLAAVARRGIKRDFWDLYELGRAGVTLADAAAAYRERFERAESDLYYVHRALTWFDDAEKDPRVPVGLTPALWKRIKTYFETEAPKVLTK